MDDEKVKQETQFRQVPGLRDIVRVAAGLRHAAAVTREAHTSYFHTIIFFYAYLFLLICKSMNFLSIV